MPAPASLLETPAPDAMIRLPADLGRRFMLWVDTEEEFDWSAPFDRAARAVTVTRGMDRFQRFIAAAGVKPVYVVDHPVAESPAAAELLRGWLAEGSADVGAHLHPWVNPPHEEAVSLANSYVGNLPPALERAKLLALRDHIEARIGVRPIAYRAGRYGLGPHSAATLEAAGFRVDSSVRSRFDYRGQHGPDFTGKPLAPYRAGPGGRLVELPLSTAFTGALRGQGERLHPFSQRSPLAGALLARTGLLMRVPLTPEGVPAAHAIAAIDALIAEDVPVLGFSFHSPTLEPGHTPYARTAADVEAFYGWWERVLAHLDRRGVRPIGLDAFVAACDGEGGQAMVGPAGLEPAT